MVKAVFVQVSRKSFCPPEGCGPAGGIGDIPLGMKPIETHLTQVEVCIRKGMRGAQYAATVRSVHKVRRSRKDGEQGQRPYLSANV